MENPRVVFMGTPVFSVPVLQALIEKYNVVGVVTQPDNVINGVASYSPIKELAVKNNIKVVQPVKIRVDFFEVIELKPDIVVTCAYGQIIPSQILDYPEYGCVNVHASLLPKLRGGAPIHRALINGCSETGITIMYMNPAMDAGDIISQESTKITDEDDLQTLHNRLSIMGRDLLMKTLPNILNGTSQRIKQDENEITFATNIKREDEKIDFDKTSWEIFNKVRGLYPSPATYCMFEGKVCKIYKCRIGEGYYGDKYIGEIVSLYKDGFGIKTSSGEIIITELQLEGKKRMLASEFLNGIQEKQKLIGKILE